MAGLGGHDKIHEDDACQHAAADSLLDGLKMATFLLGDLFKLLQLFICSTALTKVECLLTDYYRSCGIKSVVMAAVAAICLKKAGRRLGFIAVLGMLGRIKGLGITPLAIS